MPVLKDNTPESWRAPLVSDRKAKWHEARRDTIGNANTADSHRKTAMLKRKLEFDSMKDRTYKEGHGPKTGTNFTDESFAFR